MKRLLESIGQAVYEDNEIKLVISIDESSESDQVEAVAKRFEWKYGQKEIIRYPKRLGLKEHCLRCGDLAVKYGAVIFLEDDVVVAPGFYLYTKAAVSKYKDCNKVFGISLYYENWLAEMCLDFKPSHNGYDTFFALREVSHGQCWMANGWSMFRDWLAKHPNTREMYNREVEPCVYKWNPDTSWSRSVCFFLAEIQMYYVMPYHSYATNMSEVGTHASFTTDICQTALSESTQNTFKFGDFEESIVYDTYAERRDKFINSINGIEIERICLDLNGNKYDWEGFDYLLTTKRLSYKLVRTFGLNMEPIENNIRYSVPGTGISLYKIPKDYKTNKSVASIVQYDIPKQRLEHIYNKVPFRYLSYIIRNKFRNRLYSFIKRFSF